MDSKIVCFFSILLQCSVRIQSLENGHVNQRELIECLRLVVLQKEDVVKKLKEYEKRIGVEIYTTPLKFRVPLNENPDKRGCGVDYCYRVDTLCDCWFEHAYLDYMQNGECNKEMFTRICSNLENGHCEHFTEGRSFKVKMFLIHAAVATNNKKVTKYIRCKIPKRPNTLLTIGVAPAHIAVLKGSGDALQYVIDLKPVKQHYFFDGARNFSIAKRNDITGHIETFELKGCDVLTYLLAHCISPSQKTIFFQFLQSLDKTDIEDLIQEYLSSRDEEFALIVLRDKRASNMCLNSTILLNAVFLHAHDFVYSWIRQKRKLSVNVMGVKMHALFIAEALGCQECISLMRSGKRKNHAMDADVSPIIVACYSADKFRYDANTLINILKTLYIKGSCDLNKRNSSFETILHSLIKSEFLKNEAVECLLEFGCDVNAPDGEGRTPLHVLLRLNWYRVDTVKCLLEHGADVNSTDFQGRTPFMEIFKVRGIGCVYIKTLPDISMECLKLILYFNPRVDIHTDVLYKVKSREFYGCLKGCINLPLVPSNTCVSFFAILMEMGFTNYQLNEHDVLFGTLTNRESDYDDYYKQFISQPRSLQSICRVEIRRAFPGYQLHKVFRQYQIPKQLRKYIFFDDILFPE